MGNVAAIIGILLAGGKVGGLTLVEIEAIAGIIIKYEPQIVQFVALVKKAEPELYDALTKAVARAGVGRPVPTIPGRAADGSMIDIPNPDARS